MRRTLLLTTAILAITGMGLLMSGCGQQAEKGLGEGWFKGHPIYEVYPRAITSAGTFQALEEKLPEIKALGARTIWLMPIHPLGEKGRKGSAGSPYSVRDYYDVNPEYGTKEDLKSLVETAHQLGMGVILDVVLNHSANDYPLMEEHPDWWMKDEAGNFTREVADWSDVTDWDYSNDEVRRYLRDALVYWVEEFDIDGYRCDVAGMVPTDFWRTTISELRSIKPALYMLAEAQSPELIEAGFDSDYDWHLYHRLREYARGENTLASVWHAVMMYDSLYPEDVWPMRFIENHDEVRSASEEAFGNPGFRPYAGLIFTLPGQPLVYNGQEIGATHRPSLFEPEPIDWSKTDIGVLQTYKALHSLRNVFETLQHGGLTRLAVQPDNQVMAFTRHHQKDTLMVAVNFGTEKVVAKLQAKNWSRGAWSVLSHSQGDTSRSVTIENGALEVPQLGWVILRR